MDVLAHPSDPDMMAWFTTAIGSVPPPPKLDDDALTVMATTAAKPDETCEIPNR
jgi:hypothetical protein